LQESEKCGIKEIMKNCPRKKAISMAYGKILEVGIGSGRNLRYYPDNAEFTGIDIDDRILKRTEQRAKKLGLRNIILKSMDVRKLAFDNDAFDSIVSTFVFCSVPDPLAGLKQTYRVLKSGGKAIFLEHTRSDNAFLNFCLSFINIFSKILFGVSMLRDTKANIKKAGFKIISAEPRFLDIVWSIVATK